MVLVVDNYDSFTYNLVQYIQELGEKVACFRNDVSLKKMAGVGFDKVVISPGPGRPGDSGVSLDLIKTFYKKKPILGVCLGHQCIGHCFGARVVKAEKIMHGKVSDIFHNGKELFKRVKNPFSATRYHSLILDRKTFSDKLEITAETKDNVVMGIKLKGFPVWGLQFHPESILTKEGKKIIANFLKFSKN